MTSVTHRVPQVCWPSPSCSLPAVALALPAAGAGAGAGRDGGSAASDAPALPAPRCSSRRSSCPAGRARRGALQRGRRGTPPAHRSPAAPLKFAPFGADGGVDLRARRSIGGVREKYVEASGKVELRTPQRDRARRLAALRLRATTRSGARATCCCAAASTGSPAPRRGFSAIPRPDTSRRRASTSPRTAAAATPPRSVRRPRPVRGERRALHDVRRAARGLVHPDRTSSRSTSARMVGTGHDATVRFLGVPIAYTPWLEFPLSNERKSGFLTPTLGSSGMRGFDATVPYYLNLAPNYDATLTPRVMTKRGFQLGAQFRYLVSRMRRAASTPRTCRTIASPAPTATRCRGSTTRISQRCCRASPAFVEPQQGLGRHLLLRSRPTAWRSRR